MKENKPDLKIYCLQHPQFITELRSILSDKYCHSLAFNPTVIHELAHADVIVWDGIISSKMKRVLPDLKQFLTQGKVLLLIEEPKTLVEKNQFVQVFDSDGFNNIVLNGWTLLPEDLLHALDTCFQKMTNV